MWGGKFGIGKTKIYGAWDPYIYEKDKNGKPIYLKRLVATASNYDEDGKPADGTIWTYEGGIIAGTPSAEEGWQEFVCPCDGRIKYMKLVPAEGHYKYASWLKDNPIEGYSLDEQGRFSGFAYQYKDKNGEEEQTNTSSYYDETYFKNLLYQDGKKTSFVLPECSKIIMDSFLDFEQIARVEDDEYLVSKDLCPKVPGRKAKDNTCMNCAFIDYSWLHSDISMISCEADQDLYYTEDIDIRFRIREETSDKLIMVRRQNEDFDGKITIYKNLKWGFEDITGKEFNFIVPIPVGTFYIIQDHNQETYSQEGYIFPIEHGIEDIEVFDRMEKCIAPQDFCINVDRNNSMYQYRTLPQYAKSQLTVFIDPVTMRPFETTSKFFQRANGEMITGNLRIIHKNEVYYRWTRTISSAGRSLGGQIIVDATHFPGNFKLVGETYSRRRADGEDERLQFEIPLCKMDMNNSLEFQAAGEPATYNLKFKVLRKDDGVMMKLSQYQVKPSTYEERCGGSTSVIEQDRITYEPVCVPKKKVKISQKFRISPEILQNIVYCLEHDCQPPFDQNEAYLRLPETLEEADMYIKGSQSYKDLHRNLLIVEVSIDNGTSWTYVTKDDIESGKYSFTINLEAGGVE